jgi:hypothetical protein
MAATAAVTGEATVDMTMRITNPIARRRAMLNTKVLAWSLGLFLLVSYLLCVVYGLVTPEILHMHEFLETVLPGFRWLTLPGFLLGLAESYLYGVYGGIVFGKIYNAVWRRIGLEPGQT